MSDDNGSKKTLCRDTIENWGIVGSCSPIGPVRGISDELGIEEPEFVPTRHELLQLVKSWHRIQIEDRWCFFLYGQTGSTEIRRDPFASIRIGRISKILGDEPVRKAMEDAWNEFRAGRDPRLVDIYLYASAAGVAI